MILYYIDMSNIINNSKNTNLDENNKIISDINEDSKLDKSDVTRVVDYRLRGKDISLKDFDNEVTRPNIEIVSGDKGTNEWYLNDVSVKITDGDYKTYYKVLGTKEVELTEVRGEIELSGYGAYKVVAYSVNRDGIRSEVATLTIKIDDREIEPRIVYSEVEDTGNQVIATIKFNKENVFVTNNDRSYDYKFFENDKFTFEYKDATGRTGSKEADVSWIHDAVGKDGEWRYFFVEKDTIQLAEYLGEEKEIVIPAEYDGYKVLGVGNNKEGYSIFDINFEDRIDVCEDIACDIKKISYSLEEGIEYIDDYAFILSGGKELSLPLSLKSINE